MRVAEIERRADRLDPKTKIAPVPGRVLSAAVRHPEQDAGEYGRVPFHDDPIAFGAIGQARDAVVSDNQEDFFGVEGQRQLREERSEPSSMGTASIPAHVRPCAMRETPCSKKPG